MLLQTPKSWVWIPGKMCNASHFELKQLPSALMKPSGQWDRLIDIYISSSLGSNLMTLVFLLWSSAEKGSLACVKSRSDCINAINAVILYFLFNFESVKIKCITVYTKILVRMSDFVFLCLRLLTHIWSVLFPIISWLVFVCILIMSQVFSSHVSLYLVCSAPCYLWIIVNVSVSMFLPVFLCLLRLSSIKYPVCFYPRLLVPGSPCTVTE